MNVPLENGNNILDSLNGKEFENRCFGPHMILAENIPDYTNLHQTRLNGKVMQDAKLSQLIFDIQSLISYISKAIPWRVGDVLVTEHLEALVLKRKPYFYERWGQSRSRNL